MEHIVHVQADEPKQKSCLYRMENRRHPEKVKFMQIRVKSIKFQRKAAVAIYFYD
jgi:hypothetical protein